MTTSNQRSNFFRIILGSLFIFAGIVALGNNVGWWQIDDLFLEWWPLILILLGLLSVFSSGGSKGGGIVLIFVGTGFLLQSKGLFYIEDLIWPGILILVGIVIFTPKNNSTRVFKDGETTRSNEDHNFNINILFHNGHHIARDIALVEGQANCVFGNLDLDLSQSTPAPNAQVAVSAVFGKATVHVPGSWNIKQTGNSAFGGVQDLRIQRNSNPDGPTITLDLSAIFGSVELKN